MTTAKFRRIRPSDLSIVYEIQRGAVEAWIKKLARNWQSEGLGVLYVSERADGTLALIDGQHRKLALERLGRDEPVPCYVYSGLTEAQEAAQFLLHNASRATTAIDKFRIGVRAGLPDCVAVNQILNERGLAMQGDSNNGHVPIKCAAQLLATYNRGERARSGPQSLALALDTVLAAWGTNGSALDGHIVTGLSLVYHANGWVDKAHLVATLGKFPNHAIGVLGRARGRSEYERGSVSKCIAHVVADEYNKRRKTNRLEYA